MTFHVQATEGNSFPVELRGRKRWALECLMAAGARGCTSIDTPGPRWSHYVFTLRQLGLQIETLHESHDGPFKGTHGRYVLQSVVTRHAQSQGGAQ
ncbi:winged helix domain-containing protein [Roseovarius mucosus]|nr:hypothetical protein [Roseovarius mucosus]